MTKRLLHVVTMTAGALFGLLALEAVSNHTVLGGVAIVLLPTLPVRGIPVRGIPGVFTDRDGQLSLPGTVARMNTLPSTDSRGNLLPGASLLPASGV